MQTGCKTSMNVQILLLQLPHMCFVPHTAPADRPELLTPTRPTHKIALSLCVPRCGRAHAGVLLYLARGPVGSNPSHLCVAPPPIVRNRLNCPGRGTSQRMQIDHRRPNHITTGHKCLQTGFWLSAAKQTNCHAAETPRSTARSSQRLREPPALAATTCPGSWSTFIQLCTIPKVYLNSKLGFYTTYGCLGGSSAEKRTSRSREASPP
jgi:hypothetical protein